MYPLNLSLAHPQLPLAHPISSVFGEKILSEWVTESLSSFGVTFLLLHARHCCLTASPAIDIVAPEVSLTGVLLLAIVFVLRTEIPPR
jgi:hypothetical protein